MKEKRSADVFKWPPTVLMMDLRASFAVLSMPVTIKIVIHSFIHAFIHPSIHHHRSHS